MDKKIQDAIRESVREAGQDEALARKLESWFEALASGSEDVNDKQSSNRHLELLYDGTRVLIGERDSHRVSSFDDSTGDSDDEDLA